MEITEDLIIELEEELIKTDYKDSPTKKRMATIIKDCLIELKQLRNKNKILRDAITCILQKESHVVETLENGVMIGKNTYIGSIGNIAKLALEKVEDNGND